MKEVEKLKEAVNAEGDSHYINEFLKTKKFVDLMVDQSLHRQRLESLSIGHDHARI